MTIDNATVRRWAHSAWTRLDLTPPVDLRRVCEHLGIQIEKLSHNVQAAGMHVPVDYSIPVVALNQYLSDNTLRFTLAHEIGHDLVGRAIGYEKANSYIRNKSRWIERICDLFAVELLMPEQLVKEHAEELGHPRYHDKTPTLAARFGVSETAMRRRLRELGLTHCRLLARR